MRFGIIRALLAIMAMVAMGLPGSAAPAPTLANQDMIPLAIDLPALMPSLASGPLDNDFYRLGAFEDSLMLFDDIGLTAGFNVDVARLIDGYAGFNGLFPSSAALRSPYLLRASGGGYAGVRLMLFDGLRVSFGQAFTQAGRNPYLLGPQTSLWAMGGNMPFDTRSTDTALAGLSWDFAKWGNFSLTASQTSERGLGSDLDRARTTALGASARVGFGGGWVTTVSYAQANSRLRLNPVVNFEGSSLRSQSYGIAVAKQGLFGRDALGLSLSRPTPGYTTGTLGNDMQFQFYGRDKLFAGVMPETDIELGYVTSFLDRSLALDVNAAYQMNYQGQNKDEVSFVSRAKIKF